MKSSERIKRNFNLHLNHINNVNHSKNAGNMTNTINTSIPGKLTLSLSSENKINRKVTVAYFTELTPEEIDALPEDLPLLFSVVSCR